MNKFLLFKLRRNNRRAYFKSHTLAMIFVRGIHSIRQFPSCAIAPIGAGFVVFWYTKPVGARK